MAADELGLAEFPQELLGPNADVVVLGDEQPELVGQVEVGLVVGGRREEDDLALVGPDVFLDRPVAFPFAIAQVVALVDEHEPITPQVGQVLGDAADR